MNDWLAFLLLSEVWAEFIANEVFHWGYYLDRNIWRTVGGYLHVRIGTVLTSPFATLIKA